MIMNWGWKITIVMGIYMTGIISVVWYAVSMDVNLVAEDYYQQELDYEAQILRLRNTEALIKKPTFSLTPDKNYVILTFPKELSPLEGGITFYRPSDFTQDRKFKLDLDGVNQQGFVTNSFLPGLWKAKLTWQEGDKSFFQEFVIVI
jgi:nitrogen fixation protein FixH